MAALDYKQILAKKEFLPFYVYDYEIIKRQILKLKKNLPLNVKIYYSVKANPNIAILRIMKNFGLGAEIVSSGELAAVLKAGFKPGEILFAGSVKDREEISYALDCRVGIFSAESFSELERIQDIASRRGIRVKVILRFNLPRDEQGVSDLGQKATPVHGFGLDIVEASNIVSAFKEKLSNLDLQGIHIYGFNRIFDASFLVKKIEQIFVLVRRWENEFGFEFPVVDIGGGLGSTPARELSVFQFTRGLRALIRRYDFEKKNIILEAGRYFVNRAGFFVSPVIEVQENKSLNRIVIKGVCNYLLKIFGQPGNPYRRFLHDPNDSPVEVLGNATSQKRSRFLIRGRLSSVVDIFGRDAEAAFILPRPKAGDLVVIKGVGAYGLTESFWSFGSFPTAAEFLLINGKLELIRDKGKPEDFLLHQKIPRLLKRK